MGSKIKIVLRNYRNNHHLDYDIVPDDHILSNDWIIALKDLLARGNPLEKNYCWLGWPKTQRDLGYLCEELNRHIEHINKPETQQRWIDTGCGPYVIEEHFSEDTVRFPVTQGLGLTEIKKQQGLIPEMHLALSLKHGIMNRIHNDFEILQGTVEQLGQHYLWASDDTKYAIRQLNLLCHEIENLCLSQRKAVFDPDWIRPSQITTWINAPRHSLHDRHRELFSSNEYDREFGGVYMHWCQIGKTLFEVWRDEGAPDIDRATCDAITELKYYSGEFDVEWGQSVTRHNTWHREEQAQFKAWLAKQGYDPNDNAGLSLGYLPLGKIDVRGAFGTTDFASIIDTMGDHLDILRIEVDDVSVTYDYHWSDWDWREQQLKFLKPGYKFTTENV